MTPDQVSIRPFTPDTAYFSEAVNVYNSTWKWGWDESYRFFSRYAALPGFIGLVALVDNRVAGMSFGAPGRRGQWWFDKVGAELGVNNPALRNTWMLVELAVLERYRGRGIGTLLHNALLAGQPCPRAVLSTEVSNLGARRLYERLGWRYLHPGFDFSESGPAYTIMGKELARTES